MIHFTKGILRPGSRRAGLLPMAVLLAGLALTFAAWSSTRRAIRLADQARFDGLGESVALALEERMRSNERGLRGIRALYAASDEVTRQEFHEYVASLHLGDFYGVSAVSFVRAVPHAGVETFLKRTRAMGAPDFRLQRPAEGPWHYVIEYIEPPGGPRVALGYDFASEPIRRAAAETARDSGKAILTRSVRLFQHNDSLPGFVLILPIYGNNQPVRDVTGRRAALLGWASAPIRLSGFLADLETETGGQAALVVTDTDGSGGPVTLFSSHGSDSGPAAPGSLLAGLRLPWTRTDTFRSRQEVRLAGRTWTLELRSLPPFAAGGDRARASYILGGGILVSLLGAGLAGAGERSRRGAVELARRMTRDLRESEESWKFALEGAGDGVWDYFPEEGRAVYSAKGRRMLGYAGDEPFATTVEDWVDMVHPDDVARSGEDWQRHLRGEGDHYECELRLRCKDGSWKWVLDRGKVIRWREPGKPQRAIGIHQDITEVRAASQRLQETLALQEALLRNAPHGVASIDTDGIIRIWNFALERMSGYTAEEVVGRRTPAFLHEPDELAARALQLSGELGEEVAPGMEVFYAQPRRGRVDEHEWTFIRKDGSRFPALLSVAAIRDAEGRVTGYQGMVLDLTARRQAEEALRLAKAAAERADRAKSEFLAYMSHEIRTPIHGVLGLTALLARTPLSAGQEDHVRTIASSGELLLSLVNDILDYSRIEAGMLALETRAFDAREACREVLDLLRPKAEAKGLRLALEGPADAPIPVRADPGRLRQILLNLVGNAIKFTERGGVVLGAGAGPAGSEVLFEVRDTGAGVPPERRHLLFRRYTQADPNPSGREGGTGLGLVISRSLAQMMGGAIGHRDGETGGSVFWFTLPASAAESPGRAAPKGGAGKAEVAVPPPSGDASRVLVVDDNAINRKVALGMLQALDFPAESAADGAEALARLAREEFGLVLMDCEMPGMNGFEATRAIRAREAGGAGGAGSRLPIVALTANAMAENRRRCLDAGMDGYLAKPFGMDELRAVLASHLGARVAALEKRRGAEADLEQAIGEA